MISFTLLINYSSWFIFIFIGVVWMLVLLKNTDNLNPTKASNKKYKVSILIPAYNEAKTLSRTVESVINIDYPKERKEIIVINDCSTDNTGKVLAKFQKKGLIKVLTNKENRGKSYSLNRGLRIAKGEMIACIDADSMVEGDALKKMLSSFDNPQVGAVTPALKVWRTKNFLEKIQSAEYLLNIFLRKMLAFIDSIHVTPGVFSVYRKEILDKAGGFEEKNLTEDMDIALKIHEMGYKIENNLDAISYTLCPNRWRDLFKQRIRWYRGAIQNSIKHRNIFFRRRYGNLGLFFLPANFIAVAAIFGVFFSLIWNYGGTILNYLWKFSLVDWDIGVYLSGFNFFAFLADLISTPLFLGMIGLGLGGYIMYKSFLISEEKVKSNRGGYLIYLVFFPFIMMAFWTVAIIFEVLRIERRW